MGVQSAVTVLKDGPLPRVGVPVDPASSDDPEALFREARRRRRIIRAWWAARVAPRSSCGRSGCRRHAHWTPTSRARAASHIKGPTAFGGDHRNLHRTATATGRGAEHCAPWIARSGFLRPSQRRSGCVHHGRLPACEVLRRAKGSLIPFHYEHSGDEMITSAPPKSVELAPHHAAIFVVNQLMGGCQVYPHDRNETCRCRRPRFAGPVPPSIRSIYSTIARSPSRDVSPFEPSVELAVCHTRVRRGGRLQSRRDSYPGSDILTSPEVSRCPPTRRTGSPPPSARLQFQGSTIWSMELFRRMVPEPPLEAGKALCGRPPG